MILNAIKNKAIFRNIILLFLNRWVEKKTLNFSSYLIKQYKILDVGSGNCLITQNLKEKGFNIIPIDIQNLSIVKTITPIVYDGKTLPFKQQSFDTILLLTVLHHSDDPYQLITECSRVAKELIIIEDTYTNSIQKTATQIVDWLVNFGHSKMTYQNKTEKEWEYIFSELNINVLSKKRTAILFFFQQTTYHLKIQN